MGAGGAGRRGAVVDAASGAGRGADQRIEADGAPNIVHTEHAEHAENTEHTKHTEHTGEGPETNEPEARGRGHGDLSAAEGATEGGAGVGVEGGVEGTWMSMIAAVQAKDFAASDLPGCSGGRGSSGSSGNGDGGVDGWLKGGGGPLKLSKENSVPPLPPLPLSP